MNKKFAAIDIGTNTILMMIAENDEPNKLKIIDDLHSIARLGEGVDSQKMIQPAAIDRAVKILKGYKRVCDNLEVDEIFAIGTSALRDADNTEFVKSVFKNILGTEIRIIPGEMEAKLSFIGTIENDKPSIVIDIGGGSTEIIFGEGQKILERISLQVGALRITERFFSTHPPSTEEIQFASGFIREQLKKINKIFSSEFVYAVAGTPTTIAAVILGLKDYDKDKVHNYILTTDDLERIFNLFLSMDVKEIVKKLYIPEKRADVITAGTLILIEILKFLEVKQCIVNAYGLRLGVLKFFLNAE